MNPSLFGLFDDDLMSNNQKKDQSNQNVAFEVLRLDNLKLIIATSAICGPEVIQIPELLAARSTACPQYTGKWESFKNGAAAVSVARAALLLQEMK